MLVVIDIKRKLMILSESMNTQDTFGMEVYAELLNCTFLSKFGELIDWKKWQCIKPLNFYDNIIRTIVVFQSVCMHTFYVMT